MTLYLPPGDWTLERDSATELAPQWQIEQLRQLGRRATGGDTTAVEEFDRFVNTRVRVNPWRADVILDPRIVLQFAPGARLILKQGFRLITQGEIDAPDSHIIDEDAASMWIPAARSQGPLKAIWWGCGAELGRDDAERLERAIAAATTRRRPWWRNFLVNTPPQIDRDRVLPALPLILAGKISIGRSVRCGGDDPFNTRAFIDEVPPSFARVVVQVPTPIILQGVATGRARPSTELVALNTYDNGPSSARGTAMLAVEFARASRIEGISFNGNGRASRCLQFFSQSSKELDMHQILVRRCTFAGATRALLHFGSTIEEPSVDTIRQVVDSTGVISTPTINTEGQPVAATVRVVVPSSGQRYPRTLVWSDNGEQAFVDDLGTHPDVDFSGTSIVECEFDARSTDPALDAVVLRGQNSLPYNLSGCRFRGGANAFVSVLNGTSLIEGCHFDNERVPTLRLPISPATATDAVRIGNEPANGADIELKWDLLDVPFIEQTGSGRSLAGSVTLMACVSKSVSLLTTSRPSPFFQQRPNRSTLILGCQQLIRGPTKPAPKGDPNSVAAAVTWGLVRISSSITLPAVPATVSAVGRGLPPDAALCVVGCSLQGPIDVYRGASAVSLLSVRSAWNRTRPWRAQTVALGISRPIVLFGYAVIAAALLMMGCSRPPPSADASTLIDTGVNPSDNEASDMEQPDGGPAKDAPATDLAVLDDGSSTGDAHDAAPAADRATPTDAGPPARTFASFGPARQMRHICPAITDGDTTIPPPRLIYPLSGLRATSRRPGFRWELAAGTIGARIEVCADPCCARVITAYDANGTSQAPAEMLPPGVVWWRARGRTAEGYGRQTSFTWELGIRHRSAPVDTAWDHIRDINRDGYDDIVTMADTDTGGRVRMYTLFGSQEGPQFRLDEYLHPPHGDAVLDIAGGDVNADGRMDVMITPMTSMGVLPPSTLIFGQHTGLNIGAPMVLEAGADYVSIADINGDGFGDVATSLSDITRFSSPERGRLVLHGGPDESMGGVSEIPDNAFMANGRRLVTNAFTVGDLNGDGYADVIVSDFLYQPRGRILIFRGGERGVDPTPARTIEYNAFFADSLGVRTYPAGDIDGDQLADFLVPVDRRGEILVFRGSRNLMAELSVVLPPPYVPEEPVGYTNHALSRLGCGPDQDGDGRAEVTVGCSACYLESHGRYVTQLLYVYGWRPSSGLELAHTSRGPNLDGGLTNFVETASGVGDVNGDGYDELGVGVPFIDLPQVEPWASFRIFSGGSSGFSDGRFWWLRGPRSRRGGWPFGHLIAGYGIRVENLHG